MNRNQPMYRPRPGDRVVDLYRRLRPGEHEACRHGNVLQVTYLDIRVHWDDGDISSVGPFVLAPEEDHEDQDR